MSVVTINLPPGMMRNGTYYDAKDRWHDGNRVRWHNGAMRAIGGWSRVQNYQGVDIPALSADVDVEVFRDGFSWVANDGARYRIFGSNVGLSLWAADDVVYDITPAGFVGSPAQPTVSEGYGKWLYGRSIYGGTRPADPSSIGAVYRWDFATWGENLIAGPSSPGYPDTLYEWVEANGTGVVAQAITNAPLDFTGFLVTDQRIAMGIGSSSEARLIRWSDREDLTDWTPTQLNYAGEQILQGTGDLLDIQKVLDQVLILSETDAHVGRWLGAPLVYGFNRVGDDCGPWNGSVCYVGDRFAMWPGRRTFWMYDGTLRPVQCDIMDHIAETLSRADISKAYVFGIPQYNEIWWCYQSKQSATGDVDSYVAYDYIDNTWTKGSLDRTAAITGQTYVNPYMIDNPGQAIYEHERADIVVSDAWAETGPLEFKQGETNLAVRYLYPDTETFGDVSFTLMGQNMPTDAKYSYGPYTYANPIATRAMGRSISMRVDGEAVPDWKVGGKTRFDVAPMGTGRR